MMSQREFCGHLLTVETESPLEEIASALSFLRSTSTLLLILVESILIPATIDATLQKPSPAATPIDSSILPSLRYLTYLQPYSTLLDRLLSHTASHLLHLSVGISYVDVSRFTGTLEALIRLETLCIFINLSGENLGSQGHTNPLEYRIPLRNLQTLYWSTAGPTDWEKGSNNTGSLHQLFMPNSFISKRELDYNDRCFS